MRVALQKNRLLTLPELTTTALVPLALIMALVVVGSPAAQADAPLLAPPIGQAHAKQSLQALQGNVTSVDAAQDMAGQTRVNLNAAHAIANFIDLPPVTGKAQSARVDPLVFRAWLSKAHPDFVLSGSASDASAVVEVAGQWDKADKTLSKLQIPYQHVKAGQLTPEMLAGTKVLIINCAGQIKRDRLQTVRDFVKNGGYLLTTDWALDNMVAQTFPGYISWNKGVNKKDIYDAEYLSPDPVLAINTVRSAFWKLDAASHLIRILKPDAVRVLITSRQLAGEDPDKAGVLAVIFPFGRGYVLHMVGHFDNNAKIAVGNFLPDSSPAIGISLRQAIATNFIVAGMTGKRLPY